MKKVVLLLVLAGLAAFANAGVYLGKPAPTFDLIDIDNKKVNSAELVGKYLVLEWFHPLCPFTKKHYVSQNMQKLQQNYKDKNVVWISVHTDTRAIDESRQIESVRNWIKTNKTTADFYINDQDANLAKLFGAKVTPHLFVINPQGILIYQGGIDDKASTDIKDIANARNHIAHALDEVLDGNNVSVPVTRPYGCPVKY